MALQFSTVIHGSILRLLQSEITLELLLLVLYSHASLIKPIDSSGLLVIHGRSAALGRFSRHRKLVSLHIFEALLKSINDGVGFS